MEAVEFPGLESVKKSRKCGILCERLDSSSVQALLCFNQP